MTKRIIPYVIILAFSLIPPVFVNSAIGYLPPAFLLILLLLCLLYMLLLKNKLSFLEWSQQESCVRNHEVGFSVTVINRSHLVFPRVRASFFISDIFGQQAQTTTQELVLSAKEKKEFILEKSFSHIGLHKAGLNSVKIYDPLGIFFITLPCTQVSSVTVKPSCVDIGEYGLENTNGILSSLSVTKSKIAENDYSGVRAYAPGDPIKNIHWKISSHINGYMTKVYDSFANNDVMIIVDLNAPVYSNDMLMSLFDCLVESAFSLAAFALRQGRNISILSAGRETITSSYPQSDEELEKAVCDFPVISIGEGCSMELLDPYIRGRAGFDNIIVFTPNLTQGLINEAGSIKSINKHLSLFIAAPAQEGEYILSQKRAMISALKQGDIGCHVISTADDIIKVVNSR